MTKKRWYMGKSIYGEREWLEDFSWDCDWYWSGGYLGNKCLHNHFDGLAGGNNINLFQAFREYYVESPIDDSTLWRLCDLMAQFYSYKKAAQCFRYGGHYTDKGRKPGELNPEMEKAINSHLERVIIPEVRELLDENNM